MPEVKFKTVFEFGDEVFVKTDTDQARGIIVTIGKDWNGGVLYRVKFCDESAWYQAIELALEKREVSPIDKIKNDDDDDE